MTKPTLRERINLACGTSILDGSKVNLTGLTKPQCYDNGAIDENERTRILFHKLSEAVEACEKWKLQVETHGGYYLPGNAKQISQALREIEAEVERMEVGK
jgi:hypothetical protein